MLFSQVLMLYPGTDGNKNGSLTIPVIQAVLHVVFDHEDHRIFPAGTVRDEVHGHAKSGVIVLHKARVGPGRPVRMNVECAAAVVVGVVQIDICREAAYVSSAIDVLSLEDLLKAAK